MKNRCISTRRARSVASCGSPKKASGAKFRQTQQLTPRDGELAGITNVNPKQTSITAQVEQQFHHRNQKQ